MAIELGSAYISILPSTDKLVPAIRAELDTIQSDAQDAGDEAGSGFASGFQGAIKSAAGLAAGLVIGAGVTDGLTQALDQGQMDAKLKASLGLSEAESARAGKVAGALYSSNYGESMEEVNEGIKSVIQNIDGMRGASEGSLKRISEKVLNTAGVFDQDLGSVTRGVGQMMKTGMAKNADQALDIITVGFQSGADKAEDFMDTLNEYGTQFRKVGLDGKDATGLISQGLAAGARDGDLVADAVKEFSIRAIDGSEASADAFKALGLNAGDMTDKIAKGGGSAKEGLGQVLDGLRGIEDPAKRNAAAVGLFGTQAEDLGDALFALDPKKAADGLGKVGGAAKKANANMSDTPASEWQTFTRTLQQDFVKVMGSKVIPMIQDSVDWMKQNKKILAIVGGVVGTLGGAYLAYNATVKVVTAVTKGWAAATGILNGVMALNPIGLVVAAIVLLVAGLVLAWNKSETFRSIVTGAFDKVKGAASAVADFFTSTIPGAFNKVKNVAGNVKDWIVSKWNGLVDWFKALPGKITGGISSMWDKVKGGAGKAKDWIVEKFNGVVNFFKGIPEKIKNATSTMWDGIKDAFRGVMNWLIAKWNDFSITIDIPDAIPGLPDEFTLSTPNLPMFAKGGVVNQATLGVFGEAGTEAIMPLDRLDGFVRQAARIGAGAARPTAQAPALARTSTSEFVITNWRSGEGFFREIAEDVVEAEGDFGGTIGRMR